MNDDFMRKIDELFKERMMNATEYEKMLTEKLSELMGEMSDTKIKFYKEIKKVDTDLANRVLCAFDLAAIYLASDNMDEAYANTQKLSNLLIEEAKDIDKTIHKN